MSRTKIPVGILGATGTVGQKFILLLQEHPWFEVTALAASERSAGKLYREAVSWKQTQEIPEKLASMRVQVCEPPLDCAIVFSGLDSSVAGSAEQAFAAAGCWVFSNAKNHRMDDDVPLVIAELNADHLDLVPVQRAKRGWPGAIVTNANCATIALTLSLGPLERAFGIQAVQVTTMQAISGAGYPGVASLDILGNIVPFIPGEEEKLETETQKILGRMEGSGVVPAQFQVSAQCNRVPVEDGHMECVSVSLKETVSVEDLKSCWNAFQDPIGEFELPSAPKSPVVVTEEPNRPQPRLDVWAHQGMVSIVGRLRPCSIFDFKYVVLGHNTVRGAAGASVLNAELVLSKGLLD